MPIRSLMLAITAAATLTIPTTAQEETLPPLVDGIAPKNFDELWTGFDPRKEPLDIEVLKEWEKDGVVMRSVRFRVGIFKGKKSMLAGIYGFPKDAKNLPGLVQIHGGGQSAHENAVFTNAKRGYATLSLAWAGRISAGPYSVNHDGVKLFHEGKTGDPNYRVTTDWAAIDAYHDPCRNKETGFGSGKPSPWTLDAVDSPRNSPWFFWALGARRALTFLEQQPEVDPARLGVYGHSMGGQQTVALAGTDPRVKAAAPSCGGITYRIPENEALNSSVSDAANLSHIKCPIIFLMPSNDFNGRIEDLSPALDLIKNPAWRIASAPHHNHQDTPEFEVATQLFFDEHLKGSFKIPVTPAMEVQWKTPDGIPIATVQPDPAREPLRVDFYYTQQAIPKSKLGTKNLPRPAYFWRHAVATKSGQAWAAKLPLADADRPVWAFANVTYPLEKPVSGAGYYYKDYTTDRFTISSRLIAAESEELKAAGVKPSFSPGTLIESFQGELNSDWFTYKPSHWGRSTHRINELPWRAPAEAKLGIEVLAADPLNLEIALGDYKAAKALPVAPDWQEVVFAPADFKNKKGEALADFTTAQILTLGEGPGKPSPSAPKFRNLRWIAPSKRDLFAPDLSNAQFLPGVWTVQNGELTASEDQIIWTREEHSNFVLDFEFKTGPDANSGVLVYATDTANWVKNSVEIQLIDDAGPKWAKVDPKWKCGAIFGCLAPSKSAAKPVGEWNHCTITCRGPRIEVVLNGEKVTSMDMSLWTSPTHNPDGSAKPPWLSTAFSTHPTRGKIGFQGKHGGAPVWFRNIKIQALEDR